ncbi:MFS family permease [Streptomonospora nanhaiensis]|uniref:MFS family permease n=1 Tax=Streptomonospora nanhaiensis TaxID=1323731 RepID=A0A853BR40_9ACTN|nr:MFS transporter [Streptomonospora nanhaiensis]NYI97324.1 MFS family permease [Streptomonospora nanhaiensis]
MAAVSPRTRWKLGAPRAGGISATDTAPYGWAPLVVLFLVGLVDRIEASLLTGTLPLIQAEWGFSDTAAGSIPTAAAIASAAIAIPAGYLSDRHNRTRVIAIVVFCWALATVGSGLAVGFAMFYAMRVLLATAEQVDNPASSSLLADYYPPTNRPKAYGWVRMTTYLGGIGTILAGVLGEFLGWRAAFVIMALPGVVVALVCWRLAEPRRGHLDALIARSGTAAPADAAAAAARTDPPAARAYGGVPEAGPAPGPADPAAAPPFGRQVREVAAIPTLGLLSVGLMFLTAGLLGIAYWMPSYLTRAHDVGTAAAGSISGAMSVLGVVTGTLVGAWLGRRVHGAVRGGRVSLAGVGTLLGAAALVAGLLSDSLPLFTAMLFLSSFFGALAIPCVMASVADVVGAHSRGLGFAALNLLVTVGTAVGPLAVGVASDATGSLATAFIILSVPKVVGGLCMLAARWTFERDAEKVLVAARA